MQISAMKLPCPSIRFAGGHDIRRPHSSGMMFRLFPTGFRRHVVQCVGGQVMQTGISGQEKFGSVHGNFIRPAGTLEIQAIWRR